MSKRATRSERAWAIWMVKYNGWMGIGYFSWDRPVYANGWPTIAVFRTRREARAAAATIRELGRWTGPLRVKPVECVIRPAQRRPQR